VRTDLKTCCAKAARNVVVWRLETDNVSRNGIEGHSDNHYEVSVSCVAVILASVNETKRQAHRERKCVALHQSMASHRGSYDIAVFFVNVSIL
jgi:hypothetical protein